MRQLAELRAVGWPYHQRGLVATVRAESASSTAHQRFLETGPLALLPVRGGLANVVWSTTPRHAERLAALDPRGFAAAVNEVSFRRAITQIAVAILSDQGIKIAATAHSP